MARGLFRRHLRRVDVATVVLCACVGLAVGHGWQPPSQVGLASKPMFAESAAYERFMGRWSRQLAPLLVAFSEVRAADTVLDVGSGTGSLAAAVVAAFPSARVTGVDPSPEYVAYAARHVVGHGTRFSVGDAQALEFPDAAFDRVLALLVVNFIPDRNKALAEMVRVTRPGGTVSAAVWDYGDGMEMLRVFWDEAVALAPAADARDERHMPVCRRGELASLWRAHGLEQVIEQPVEITMWFDSFDDYWRPFLGGQGPAGAYVGSLSAADRGSLEQRLRRRLLGASRDGPFTLRGRAWAVRGNRPRADARSAG